MVSAPPTSQLFYSITSRSVLPPHLLLAAAPKAQSTRDAALYYTRMLKKRVEKIKVFF
jgi:hypothetical protein